MTNKYSIFIIVLAIISFACSSSTNQTTGQKQFEPNFESLSRKEAAPEWFADAKLGMYFHWGPYSVPAFGSGLVSM